MSGEPRRQTGLEIRVRGAKATADQTSTHDVEARIEGGGLWSGESVLDYGALSAREGNPEEYGRELGRQLLNPKVARAFSVALGKTGAVRIRLALDGEPSRHHTLRWERMYWRVGDRDWPVATSPDLAFTRYIVGEREDTETPEDPVFRLLLAVANPSNLPDKFAPVEVEPEIESIINAFMPFREDGRLQLCVIPGVTPLSDALKQKLKEFGAQVIAGPSTIESIAAEAQRRHGLHIIAHGNFRAAKRQGFLLLEGKDGELKPAADDDLAAWVHDRLQLVVLQACNSAAPAPEDGPPFVGIAPKMILGGVPAVVAMQDFVAMDDARPFVREFYKTLLREGLVDVAVNTGRRVVGTSTRSDNWSIPALFSRVKDGRLWRSDPWRELARYRVSQIKDEPEVRYPLPLQLVRSSMGTKYDPAVGPNGPILDLQQHSKQLAEKRQTAICLVGAPGMAKTSVLKWLYAETARQFLEGKAGTPVPLLLCFDDLRNAGRLARNPLAAVVAAQWNELPCFAEKWKSADVDTLMEGRRFVFLVDSGVLQDPVAREDGFCGLKRLRELHGESVFVVTFSEEQLAEWDDSLTGFEFWILRPMDLSRVRVYLAGHPSKTAVKLCETIENKRYDDLAGVPWLLTKMLNLAEREQNIDSRARVLDCVAADNLRGLNTLVISRASAEAALDRLAWEMQRGRNPSLGAEAVYAVFAAVRGTQDFRLTDLRDALTRECLMLAPCVGGGVRFVYPSMQAYFAARFLRKSPAHDELMEDITASLGRLARLRWWDDTLVILAGLMESADPLLRAILAGSSLMEGEQVYLAARCLLESKAARKKPVGEDVTAQVVDTLIWRSHPANLRPYSYRVQALNSLAELRERAAALHLVRLACDRIAQDWDNNRRHDFSGIRLTAVKGLLLMPQATMDYVRRDRADLHGVLDAWRSLPQVGPAVAILDHNDPSTSPVAAFALGQVGSEEARQALRNAYVKPGIDPEVHWAITDLFGRMDAAWVTENVIQPEMKREQMDHRLCYLIGKVGLATAGSNEWKYLRKALTSPESRLQSRALRAFADLRDPSDQKWLRSLCEAIAKGDWKQVRSQDLMELGANFSEADKNRLRHAALEALRTVGNAGSIKALREIRSEDLRPSLYQLSFDVAEEIYWRLTGGLRQETYTGDAFQPTME
ncbi:MAG: CHAT domain-containing protein [Bryobacteraceae bacterium]